MTEIPESLRSLFTARVQQSDGSYVLEVPSKCLDGDTLSASETYRVALLEPSTPSGSDVEDTRQHNQSGPMGPERLTGPPVDEGEIREVSIETIGEKGDGIAKVERGYVVIVSDARPGDEPTVKIEKVKKNVAFASICDH